MLLVTFSQNNRTRIGVLDRARNEIVDLSQAAPDLPREMIPFVATGSAGLDKARTAVASGKARLALSAVELKAPIPRPARNILCVGKNYREHAKEVQATAFAGADKDGVPPLPVIFTKWSSSVIGPGDPIPAHLDPSNSTDYEGELGVIIGPGGRGISRADAMRHVYGYTVINDVTARVVQRRHEQWFLGKSIDGFCPMGPAILTADDVADVGALSIQTRVNGELRQDSKAAMLIFDIPMLIETISALMTLEPGDIISTGTPAGVGVGFKPPKFLQAGDKVAVTIAPIGTLENTVT
ncbi:MAG TPA: fumarylacetoacetate hydrolase family protein [Burkholderiales bacterium]|nr:fumarylacetoacetate hydrolase family protein [Burkholderiales bacterium]